MAKANKIARFVKEPPRLERPYKRNGQSKPTGLYLLELRSRHAAAQSPLPRKKILITIESKDPGTGFSKEIKISHS